MTDHIIQVCLLGCLGCNIVVLVLCRRTQVDVGRKQSVIPRVDIRT